MTTFLVPLTNIPQIFEIALAGVNYLLSCRWNDAPDAGWVMDLALGDTSEVLACNIPLITGADCLAGLGYLGIDGQLVVFTDGDDTAVPTFTNLGVEANLYFLTDAASNG